MVNWLFELGEIVRSEKVGTREEFYGTIHNRFVAGQGNLCYQVRDKSGAIWHRDASEIIKV